MSDPRADVALLVDFTDLRHSLCPERAAKAAEAAGEPPPPARTVDPAAIVQGLLRFASEVGRVAIARAYADWSQCSSLARELSLANLEPVLVPGTPDGEDRSHIRLVVDALEALYDGDEPDAYVLVTGDPTMLPLVQKLRAEGSEVLLVAPAQTVSEDLRAAADRFHAIEDVLAGVQAEPARPRPWRGARTPPAPAEALEGHGTERARERVPHPTPVASESDFDTYDWAPFVLLIDELEHRLPFVGVRYLVNKVLGGHNCGVEDPRLKRDLINRAVDDGLLEMYPVGNVGDRADPVTACRLERTSEAVVGVLGATSTPEAPAEHHDDDATAVPAVEAPQGLEEGDAA